MNHSYEVLKLASGLEIHHMGPSLEKGAMPSLFYLALSGEESLKLEPFNQPIQFLNGEPIRIFSFDIPGHGKELESKDAMSFWAEKYIEKQDIIEEFKDQALAILDYLVREKLVDTNHLGVIGLSRGGFLGTHLASQDERFRYLLGYAPLTSLSALKEFANLRGEDIEKYDLVHLVPKLLKCHVRFYIGNLDMRVGTQRVFEFIQALAQEAYKQRIRSPLAELMIGPSIGHKGHGTSPEIFREGIQWIKSRLF